MKKTDRELNALSKSLENRIMLFFMPFIISKSKYKKVVGCNH